MNPGDPNQVPPTQGAEGYPAQPQGYHSIPGGGYPYAEAAPATGAWVQQTAVGAPGQPPTSQPPTPQPWGTPPPRAFGVRERLPAILLGASVLAGVVTYFMGFVSWVVLDVNATEDEVNRWGVKYAIGDTGIPGFASYEVVLNPGKFLILLGAVAVAAALALVPRFRRAVPILAVVAAGGWLALLSAAITLVTGPILSLGAGAIVALIFGFFQWVLLAAAAVIAGLSRE